MEKDGMDGCLRIACANWIVFMYAGVLTYAYALEHVRTHTDGGDDAYILVYMFEGDISHISYIFIISYYMIYIRTYVHTHTHTYVLVLLGLCVCASHVLMKPHLFYCAGVLKASDPLSGRAHGDVLNLCILVARTCIALVWGSDAREFDRLCLLEPVL